MAKNTTKYRCSNPECDHESFAWFGICSKCRDGSGEEVAAEESVRAGVKIPRGASPAAKFVELRDVSAAEYDRQSTGIAELDRVLGGGLVPGSYIALTGEPGAGKTTIATQMVIALHKLGISVAYVSGEESPAQAKMRFERLTENDEDVSIPISDERSVERIVEAIARDKPTLIVIDSIQTLYSEGSSGIPGSISQVRECVGQLQAIAKDTGTSIILVAQVTKTGGMAGPKEFEHAVDAVLSFEGDRREQYRVLRSEKNRFGSTDEVAIFEMTGHGLEAIDDPSRLFVEKHADGLPGSVICPVLEGSRVLLCEIQALVRPSNLPSPMRVARGLEQKRVQMLLAVISQRQNGNFRSASHDVFLNVSGGLRLDEPALDLAICTAIISAAENRPVKDRVCVFGEVSLLGMVRPAAQADRRVTEADRLGYHIETIEGSVKDAIYSALGEERDEE